MLTPITLLKNLSVVLCKTIYKKIEISFQFHYLSLLLTTLQIQIITGQIIEKQATANAVFLDNSNKTAIFNIITTNFSILLITTSIFLTLCKKREKMKNQLTLLTTSALLLATLSSMHIKTAARMCDIDVSYKNSVDEITKKKLWQLWKAAHNGHLEGVTLAIAQGADVNTGYTKLLLSTPLQAAASNGHLSIVRLLLEKGARFNATTYGATPLEGAVNNGHLEVVQLLLKNGAPIEDATSGTTPLLSICGAQNIDPTTVHAIVAELLAHKADINARNIDFNNTPLMRAIYILQNKDIARLLILAEADVTLTDKEGKNALDIIQTNSMHQAVNNAIEEYIHIQLHAQSQFNFFE